MLSETQKFVLPKVDRKSFTSITDLIEFNAAHNGSFPAVLQMSKDNTAAPLGITFWELREAVLRCCAWIQSRGLIEKSNVANPKARPVALFMNSDVTLFIYCAALIRLAVPIAFFSSKLSRPALKNLVETINPCAIIASPHLDRTAEETLADSPIAPEVIQPLSYSSLLDSHGALSRLPIPPAGDIAVREKAVNAYINHTSGTTGLPKPVYHTNKIFLGLRLVNLPRAPIVFSPPIFHTYGLTGPIMMLFTGCPLVLAASTTVPTARATIDIIKASNASYLASVPSILDDLAHLPDHEGIDVLRTLDRVIFAGAPLKETTGQFLADEGVKLLNTYGSTEVGIMTSIDDPFRDPDVDWRYIKIDKDYGVTASPTDDPKIFTLSFQPPGWTEPFQLADLLEKAYPMRNDIFRVLGRTDDVLVLSNGEKVKPMNMEEEVGKHPGVKACVCFGNDRFQLGLLVELWEELDLSDAGAVSAMRDELWAYVKLGNNRMDKTGQIENKSLMVLTTYQTKPLARTPKGSLSRKNIYQDFEAEINQAYERMENESAEDAPPVSDEPAVRAWLRRLITDALGETVHDWSDQDDVFELGLDSLQATVLRRKLQASLNRSYGTSEQNAPKLPPEFIFAHPTVDALVQGWTTVVTGASEAKQSRKEMLLGVLEQYKAVLHSMKKQLTENYVNGHITSPEEGAVVLLTGTTGSLGSFTLQILASMPAVSKIICMNRPNASRSLAERQKSALARAGIQLTEEESAKVELLEAEVTKPNLGLSPDAYNGLKRVTHIMHVAWPVDWKRSIQSFGPQLVGVCNMVELAIKATQCHPSTPTTIIFVSSISSAQAYSKLYPGNEIPEVFIDDPDVTLNMGYGESKWVSEMLLREASYLFPGQLTTASVRVGQISSSEASGSWPESENIPIMVKSCQTMGCIPDMEGVITWTPVNKVAGTLVDMAFSPTVARQNPAIYNLDNPHPQPWSTALKAFASALGITKQVPYSEWIAMIQADDNEEANPAYKLSYFFAEELPLMASVSVRFATSQTTSVSETFREMPEELDEKYFHRAVNYWKSRKYLA